MDTLTGRDRIAIAVIMAAILLGWGVRYYQHLHPEPGMVLHKGAIEVPAELAAPAPEADSTPSAASLFAPVDLNTASAGELETLPLIGRARAEAIVRYRELHGRFLAPADIMQVPGIGPAIFERIRGDIAAGPDSAGSPEK